MGRAAHLRYSLRAARNREPQGVHQFDVHDDSRIQKTGIKGVASPGGIDHLDRDRRYSERRSPGPCRNSQRPI